MDRHALLQVAAAARCALVEFAAGEVDPVRALGALATQIDEAVLAATPKVSPEDRAMLDEMHAVFLDQIAVTQRVAARAKHAMS